MTKAIFYKEWIKCRAVLLLLLFIALALVAYLFINNANLIRTSGAIGLWAQIAEGGFSVYPELFKLFMPIAALVISAKQYSVEMTNKRFKLTLHLPHSESKIIGSIQLFGVVSLVSLYLIMILSTHIGLSMYYPKELTWFMLMSVVPYMLGGIACYFFTMWVIVEPIWKRRVAYFFIAVISLYPFSIETTLGASTCAFPAFISIIGASVVTAYYSASRFKDGAQK
ncbi:MAG: hypothetical protein R3Y51_00725 [Rikenellaceae bacterium]